LLYLTVAAAATIEASGQFDGDLTGLPKIAFVKRHHFAKPFGIGSMIAWDIHSPGGGIYIYDPKKPDKPREVFRRDDGVVFDMSVSFNARKLLFSWRAVKPPSRKCGPLVVSAVGGRDRLDKVLDVSIPQSSEFVPSHTFRPKKGGREWVELNLAKRFRISSAAVYWFDDGPGGDYAVPQSWRLLYKRRSRWVPVKEVSQYNVEKDTFNCVKFEEVEARALRIELKCREGKSAGLQRWRIGDERQHAAIFADEFAENPGGDDERSFHIYEINVDGTGLRQVTSGPYHDIHPFYLPGGKVGFVSTRVEGYTLCQPGAACCLYVADADGGDIRRIHFGTLADHSPFVMDDGSILFTRWEYQDKDLTFLQGLWTVNPDGSRVQLYFGNTIFEPAVIWQAKPIPGSARVVCTLAPHHNNPVGAVGIIDRHNGLENPLGIRNITPEVPFRPERNERGFGDREYPWAYRDPYPSGEGFFLVADGNEEVQRYELAVLDEEGGKKMIYKDDEFSCFNPLPLVERPQPHRLAEPRRSEKDYGVFFVADVYRGLRGVKRGEVKSLRVTKVIAKCCNMRGHRAYDMDPIMSRGTYYAKHCLGTVPVDEKGRAYFKAPAGVELYFQALDANGKELHRMGSVTQITPGEMQSCIGCHESRFMAPPNRPIPKKLLAEGPVDITPPPWGDEPMDFVRHVQPVFDKYCVKCHSGADPKGGIDLSGDKTRYFNMAYDNLTERRLVNYYWLLSEALVRNFRPLESGARVSRLVEVIEQGHSGVNMDNESRRRIYTWIEANATYYGTYEHTRPGTPGSRDVCWKKGWFDDIVGVYRSRCASCHGEKLHRRNNGLHQTWLNFTHPAWSRMLNAPLAKSAGGLGLCRDRDSKEPVIFKDRSDADYQAVLQAIQQGGKELYEKPRMDMANARPLPYRRDFGTLFTGFSGP